MKHKQYPVEVPDGNAKAAARLLDYAAASSALNLAWGAPNRGSRNPPYDPFNPRKHIRQVLSTTEDERVTLDEVEKSEAVSDAAKRERIVRLQKSFHRNHRDAVVGTLVAQKLGLAEMQMQARVMLEEGLITAEGETLHDVLARAEILQQAGTMLHSRHDGQFVAQASDIHQLFPPNVFRIDENRLSVSQFHALVDEYAERLRLPPEIASDYRLLYRRMVNDSKDIHAFRKDHPNDKALFRSCFGFFPTGDIQIVQGPLSLYFRCGAIADYAKIYAGQRNGSKEPNQKQLKRASMTGGATLGTSWHVPFGVQEGLVIEQNDPQQPFIGSRVDLYRHEDEHVQGRYYEASWMHAPGSCPSPRSKRMKKNGTSAVRAIRTALDVCRTVLIETCGKDELLAQYREKKDPHTIQETLLDETPGALYAFPQAERRKIGQTGATRASPRVVGELMREHFDDRYSTAVRQAIAAVVSLEDLDFERPFIIELLRTEPLANWSRLARLIAESRTAIAM